MLELRGTWSIYEWCRIRILSTTWKDISNAIKRGKQCGENISKYLRRSSIFHYKPDIPNFILQIDFRSPFNHKYMHNLYPHQDWPSPSYKTMDRKATRLAIYKWLLGFGAPRITQLDQDTHFTNKMIQKWTQDMDIV